MLIDLDREDLIALVKGTQPNYSVMDDELISSCGAYSGGFNDEWRWNYSFCVGITEEELYNMYLTCKNSWK